MRVRAMYHAGAGDVIELPDGRLMAFDIIPGHDITENDLRPYSGDIGAMASSQEMWLFGLERDVPDVGDFFQTLTFLIQTCECYRDALREHFPDILNTASGRRAVEECKQKLRELIDGL